MAAVALPADVLYDFMGRPGTARRACKIYNKIMEPIRHVTADRF